MADFEDESTKSIDQDLTKLMQVLIPLPPVKQVFKSASKSRANTFHYTFLFEDNVIDCTCEGWVMSGKCWHTTKVREVMGDGVESEDWSVSLD